MSNAIMRKTVHVDVIIPVHNASETIEETVQSVFRQSIPEEWGNYPNWIDPKDSKKTSLSVLDSYKRHSLNDEIETIYINICCYDDGSTDDSWNILKRLQKTHEQKRSQTNHYYTNDTQNKFIIHMMIASNESGIAQGAGSARNRAVALHKRLQVKEEVSSSSSHQRYLCFIDSDDIMHEHRVAHQLAVMLAMPIEEQNATLLGCTFDRIPQDSTWHYTKWANSLSDDRLSLERYREVTVIQPTWFMTRSRFEMLGGYIESSQGVQSYSSSDNIGVYKLIHSEYETIQTLRLAEDLRFFHAHLSFPYCNPSSNHEPICTIHGSNKRIQAVSSSSPSGTIKLVRTSPPLMTYRHREGQSQSSSTSRKLLLHLRAKAFMDTVVRNNNQWLFDPNKENVANGFVIWGAGRDGKDFFKSLSHNDKHHVRCFVDVDEKKIHSGYYMVPFQNDNDRPNSSSSSITSQFKIPILHYSMLIKDETLRHQVQHEYLHGDMNSVKTSSLFGSITKCKPEINHDTSVELEEPPNKKTKHQGRLTLKKKLHAISKRDEENHKLMELLPTLSVVVCVAMYRSNGTLESNVKSIGRQEGVDLWHFS